MPKISKALKLSLFRLDPLHKQTCNKALIWCYVLLPGSSSDSRLLLPGTSVRQLTFPELTQSTRCARRCATSHPAWHVVMLLLLCLSLALCCCWWCEKEPGDVSNVSAAEDHSAHPVIRYLAAWVLAATSGKYLFWCQFALISLDSSYISQSEAKTRTSCYPL